VSVVVTTTGGPAITLSAPKAQRINQEMGDRNGARLSANTFLLTKDSGNDVFEVLQGTKS